DRRLKRITTVVRPQAECPLAGIELGRRIMSKSTWTGAVNSDWADPDNWSPAGMPRVNSDVVIATGTSVASASIGTVNSITDSSDLRFRSAGTNTVTTFLDN